MSREKNRITEIGLNGKKQNQKTIPLFKFIFVS